MKLPAISFIVSMLLVPVMAGEREDAYFNKKCLPLVRDFIRRNELPYDPNFSSNKVSNYRISFSSDSARRSSRMMLEKRYAVLFLGNEKTNAITFFHDKASKWSFNLLEPQNEPKMRELAARTNLLNNASALDLAKKYFRLQGHDEKNFRSVKFEQAVWAKDVPSKRIVLPFYEAEWLRLDAGPIHGSLPPTVRITISGLESNMAHYTKIALPIEFGHDWETKTNTGSAYPPR